MKKVNYAIIPASGKGTRFHPITSVISKEMLPLNGIPAVQYSVMECINAGINKIAITVRPNDDLIMRYFLNQSQFKKIVVSEFTMDENKLELLIKPCDLPPKGNATSILALKKYIQQKKFAVLFPDDVIFDMNSMKDLLSSMQSHSSCASALLYTEVPTSEIHNYGNIDIDTHSGTINKIIQKPQDGYISNHVVISRIITDYRILTYLEMLGEKKDLGTALGLQCQDQKVIGCKLTGEWVSVDSPTNYAHAVTTALKYLK